MFEEQTENNIKERMLNNVPSNVCKLEGSFIYDAVSPISVELAGAYMALDCLIKNIFMENIKGEFLEKRAAEYGLYRKEGTKAEGKVEFTGKDGKYPKGILVQTPTGCKYKTTEELSIEDGKGKVKVEAYEVGSKYNAEPKAVSQFPAAVMGLSMVINKEHILGGTNIENDDELLKRLLNKIQCPSTSGNINHYKQWAMEIAGVGAVKVVTYADGSSSSSKLKRGDVKLIIVSSDKKPLLNETVKKVKEHVEEERPIGVNLIVQSAKEKKINISVSVEMYDGFKLDDIKDMYNKKLDEYRKEIAFNQNEISYARLGALLIGIPGVKDYDNLIVNGDKENIILNDDEVPLMNIDTLAVKR